MRKWLINRLHLDWLPGILFRPQRTLAAVVGQPEGVWITPMLTLTITAILLSFAIGNLRQQAVSMGEIRYPPGYEYYTPEQQAQFMQAAQATSGPVFIYLIPIVGNISGVWFGWLIISSVLHLLMTLLGGRGTTTATVNLVAWASIPYAVRDLIRLLYVVTTKKQIEMVGLSGLAPVSDAPIMTYFTALLALIDIFLIWKIILIIIGVDQATKLSRRKVIAGVTITMLALIGVQALGSFLLSMLSDLTVIRPFMF